MAMHVVLVPVAPCCELNYWCCKARPHDYMGLNLDCPDIIHQNVTRITLLMVFVVFAAYLKEPL